MEVDNSGAISGRGGIASGGWNGDVICGVYGGRSGGVSGGGTIIYNCNDVTAGVLWTWSTTTILYIILID